MVGLLSGQAAVAMVNARLYEDAHLRAEKLAVAYADLQQLDRLKTSLCKRFRMNCAPR